MLLKLLSNKCLRRSCFVVSVIMLMYLNVVRRNVASSVRPAPAAPPADEPPGAELPPELVGSLPLALLRYVRFPDRYAPPPEPALDAARALLLRERLERDTYDTSTVVNWRRFGPVLRHTPHLVVRVHRDAERLQCLIISLAEVRRINTVLLIFSHSYYDPKINELIQNINFCKVMQIFYPFSVQSYPNDFPGPEPNGSAALGAAEANRSCGPRDSRRAELKHHWWWQARYVFEYVEWAPSHEGMVLFLDEASYVAPDLLHVMKYLPTVFGRFPRVMLANLGNVFEWKSNASEEWTFRKWQPAFDVGLAFNKSVYRVIARLAERFCAYEDCDWGSSLLQVFRALPGRRALTAALRLPRVVSTRGFATGSAVMRQLRPLFLERSFPPSMHAAHAGRRSKRPRPPRPRVRCCWADARDHALCRDPFGPDLLPSSDDGTPAHGNEC